jgi:hypothetical protein
MPVIMSEPTDQTKLSKEELILEARRCARITNTVTGRIFERPDPYNPLCRWPDVFREALMNPKVFEVEMEEKPRGVVRVIGDNGEERRAVHTKIELDSLSMPELRKIGTLWGVKASSKPGIIVKILEAQQGLIMQDMVAPKE